MCENVPLNIDRIQEEIGFPLIDDHLCSIRNDENYRGITFDQYLWSLIFECTFKHEPANVLGTHCGGDPLWDDLFDVKKYDAVRIVRERIKRIWEETQ